jgi:hypothetical protein
MAAATEPESGSFVFGDGSRYGASHESAGAWSLRLVRAADGQFERVDGVVKRHGHGTYTDGAETYEGEWSHDAMHGQGRYRSATGSSYEVRWLCARLASLAAPLLALRRGGSLTMYTKVRGRTSGATGLSTPAGGRLDCELHPQRLDRSRLLLLDVNLTRPSSQGELFQRAKHRGFVRTDRCPNAGCTARGRTVPPLV